MNPIIELKERLHQSAMAGTDLLNEDFRLRKIAEQIKPLSAKNPVFKKISERLEELFNAGNEDKPIKLINAISLVDAVVVTQSTYKIDEDISELPENSGTYFDISYFELFPIMKALTERGSGRYEIIESLYNSVRDNPDDYKEKREFKIMSDFRLRKYWIKALNDSYTGICDLAVNILSLIADEKIILQLKEDFDVNGKKEMERRLKIIGSVRKEKDNDFYIYVYENGSSALKLQAIECMKYSKNNIEYLIKEVKKRKGDLKNEILNVIAYLSDENNDNFWQEFFEKTDDFKDLSLENTKTERVSEVIVDKTCKYLVDFVKETFSCKSDNVGDYLKFVANSFNDIGNKLYSSFSDTKYDVEYSEDFKNFLFDYNNDIKSYLRGSKTKDYNNNFTGMRCFLFGCTMKSLIRLGSFVTPVLYDLVKNNDISLNNKYIVQFFTELNKVICYTFIKNPNVDDANRILVLYRMYNSVYSKSAFCVAVYLNPNITYNEFFELASSENNLADKLRKDLFYKSQELPENSDKDSNIINYIRNDIGLIKSKMNIERLHISWLENLKNFNIPPEYAYRLLPDNPTYEEKVAVNDYMLYIIKCYKSAQNRKYFYDALFCRVVAAIILLEVTDSIDVLYEYSDKIIKSWCGEDIIEGALILNKSNIERKIKFIDDVSKVNTNKLYFTYLGDNLKNKLLNQKKENYYESALNSIRNILGLN